MPGLNNAATQDVYVAALELTAPKVTLFDVIVANAAVAAQFGTGWPGVSWLGETFLPPNNYVFDREGLTGIRFRSWVKGVPARVTVTVAQDFGGGS